MRIILLLGFYSNVDINNELTQKFYFVKDLTFKISEILSISTIPFPFKDFFSFILQFIFFLNYTCLLFLITT